MAFAMANTCLLCDSDNVKMRNDDAYRCAGCGFDSDIARTESGATLVNQYRDLKNAFYDFTEAEKRMKMAVAVSYADVVTNTGGAKYQYLDEASALMLNGIGMMRDLISKYPELLSAPSAEGKLTAVDAFMDVHHDNIFRDLKVLGKIKNANAELQSYMEMLSAMQLDLRQRIVSIRR